MTGKVLCTAVLVVSVLAVETVDMAPSHAAGRKQRIVSTSGVPHADVADYRRSPLWRAGMPKGATVAWRTYMTTVVRQVSAGAGTVLHQGDMVEGRWGLDATHKRVFGPVRTYDQRYAAVRRAGNVIYPWLKSFWRGHRMLWGTGDHESGDMGGSGIVEPSDFRYRAHSAWERVWAKHFGASVHANRRGDVGVITLDPIMRWSNGLRARIPAADLRWMRSKIHTMRGNGVRWMIVQSEIPAVGPNRAFHTSSLLLENGTKLWADLADLDVDLLCAAEFHADTAHTNSGRIPMEVVHGGRHARASWLVIDEYANRLQLTLKESVGSLARSTGNVWAPSLHRVGNRPVAGRPHVTGRATIWPGGSVTRRSGSLTEGP